MAGRNEKTITVQGFGSPVPASVRGEKAGLGTSSSYDRNGKNQSNHSNSEGNEVSGTRFSSRRRYRTFTNSSSDLIVQPTEVHVPRFLVIKPKSGDFSKTSPFLIEAQITNLIGTVNSVRKIQEGLLIEAISVKQAMKIREITHFANVEVEVCPHGSLNTSKGIITCRDLLNCSEDEIKIGLADQGVTDVRRMTVFRNGTRQATPSIILTFNSPALPQKIKAGFHVLPVRVYIPPPMRCFKCQQFNHTSSRCENDGKCHCGLAPHEDQCTETPNCVNCNGNHFASSRSCPVYQKEAAIQRMKATERLSYVDARRKYNEQNPQLSRSYAHVANVSANTYAHKSNITDLAKLLIPELLRLLEDHLPKRATGEPASTHSATVPIRLQNPIPTVVLSKTLPSSLTAKNGNKKAYDNPKLNKGNSNEQRPTGLPSTITANKRSMKSDEAMGTNHNKESLAHLQERAETLLYDLDPLSRLSSSTSGENSLVNSRENSRTREHSGPHSCDESPPTKKKSNTSSRVTSPDSHSPHQPPKWQTMNTEHDSEMDTDAIFSPKRNKKEMKKK